MIYLVERVNSLVVHRRLDLMSFRLRIKGSLLYMTTDIFKKDSRFSEPTIHYQAYIFLSLFMKEKRT